MLLDVVIILVAVVEVEVVVEQVLMVFHKEERVKMEQKLGYSVMLHFIEIMEE
jgi:hypothetical protein